MMMRSYLAILLSPGVLLFNPNAALGQDPLSPEELLRLKTIGVVQLSPDNHEMIYSVSTPRGANEKPGGATRQYFRASLADWTGTIKLSEQCRLP